MVQATEKICPYCQNPILEGEHMVLCSQCGVPHHEECWKANEGCTVYGCKGWALWPGLDIHMMEDRTIQPADLTQVQAHELLLACPKCGSRVTKGMTMCGACGYELPNWMVGRWVVDIPWWMATILAVVIAGGVAAAVNGLLPALGSDPLLEWPQLGIACAAVLAFALVVGFVSYRFSFPMWYSLIGVASAGSLFLVVWVLKGVRSRRWVLGLLILAVIGAAAYLVLSHMGFV